MKWLSRQAPFAEVGGANQAASTLVSLLVGRETSSHPLRLFLGLGFGYFTGFLAHSAMGVFDVLCVFSTTAGSLGFLLVVGSNFHPLFYFLTAPLVLFFGTPYWDQYFGLEPELVGGRRDQGSGSRRGINYTAAKE